MLMRSSLKNVITMTLVLINLIGIKLIFMTTKGDTKNDVKLISSINIAKIVLSRVTFQSQLIGVTICKR